MKLEDDIENEAVMRIEIYISSQAFYLGWNKARQAYGLRKYQQPNVMPVASSYIYYMSQ